MREVYKKKKGTKTRNHEGYHSYIVHCFKHFLLAFHATYTSSASSTTMNNIVSYLPVVSKPVWRKSWFKNCEIAYWYPLNSLILQGFVYIKKAIADLQSNRADGEERVLAGLFL